MKLLLAIMIPCIAFAEQPQDWKVQTSTSRIDDSKTISLQLFSENSVDPEFGPIPAVLCITRREGQYLASIAGCPAVNADKHDQAQVIVRWDKDQATKQQWSVSSSGSVIFAPQEIDFIKKAMISQTLIVRIFTYKGALELCFKTDGLIPAMKRAGFVVP